MKVVIDKYAGFCFGVINAINSAEKFSKDDQGIFCLGEIVHNSKEEKRLVDGGMKTIKIDDLDDMSGKRVLIRAHGEPPQTYEEIVKSGNSVIDATCPVVLKLQKRIKEKAEENPNNQIVIYGKKGHAEVNGLVGQTNGNALVISSIDDAKLLDLSKKTFLYSQTTSNFAEYIKIGELLSKLSFQLNGSADFITVYQTICPSVKNRVPHLREFCGKSELILFVSDENSSNGKMLFDICKEVNPNSHFITGQEDILIEWLNGVESVGISGATSTPLWLMENVSSFLINLSTI